MCPFRVSPGTFRSGKRAAQLLTGFSWASKLSRWAQMAPEAQCGINLGLVTEQGDTPKSLFFPQKKIRSSDYDWTCGISPQCYKIMDAPNCNLCGEHDVQLLESVAYSSIWFVAKLLKQTFNGHRETRRCCAMSNLLCGALSQWSVWK